MGKKSTKTSNKPWSEAQPYLLGAADNLQGVYNFNKDNIQNSADQLTGLLPSLIDKYKQGNANVNAATDYNTSVLGGKYLDAGNPYLQQMIDKTINDTTNSTQAALGLRGLTGGSTYADLISKNAANASLGMRYQDYGAERDRMANAASQAPGLAMADYMAINPALSVAQASTMPVQAASGYAGGLGGLLGGYGTQTQPGGWGNQLLSAGTQLGSAAIMASERRVKRDIVKLGEYADGLGQYRYNYVWDAADEPHRFGVMVDEVEALRPWALGPVIDGVQTVDYSQLEAA